MLVPPGSLLRIQKLRTCTRPAESECAFDHSAQVLASGAHILKLEWSQCSGDFTCIKFGDVLDISVYVDTKL